MSGLAQNGVTSPSPVGVDRIPYSQTALDVAAAAVLKTAPGRLARVAVIVAGSAAGAAYDGVSTAGNTVANQVAVIPNAVGVYDIDWPCLKGIVIVPGTGQTLSVAFY